MRTSLLKARVNWKYCLLLLFRLLYCKRLKYSVQKRESCCFLNVKYAVSEQDPEFGVIIMEIKVAEINAHKN